MLPWFPFLFTLHDAHNNHHYRQENRQSRLYLHSESKDNIKIHNNCAISPSWIGLVDFSVFYDVRK